MIVARPERRVKLSMWRRAPSPANGRSQWKSLGNQSRGSKTRNKAKSKAAGEVARDHTSYGLPLT